MNIAYIPPNAVGIYIMVAPTIHLFQDMYHSKICILVGDLREFSNASSIVVHTIDLSLIIVRAVANL